MRPKRSCRASLRRSVIAVAKAPFRAGRALLACVMTSMSSPKVGSPHECGARRILFFLYKILVDPLRPGMHRHARAPQFAPRFDAAPAVPIDQPPRGLPIALSIPRSGQTKARISALSSFPLKYLGTYPISPRAPCSALVCSGDHVATTCGFW
jgi:hypothetical protein